MILKKRVFSTAFPLFLLSMAGPAMVFAQLPAVVDPASAECLDCHQDSVTVSEPLSPAGECDHSIGVSYSSVQMKNRGLVPVAALDPAVKLLDGNIGCLTCHVPYSEADHESIAASRTPGQQPDPMLVKDNTGSGLCAACHRK